MNFPYYNYPANTLMCPITPPYSTTGASVSLYSQCYALDSGTNLRGVSQGSDITREHAHLAGALSAIISRKDNQVLRL